MGLTEGLRLGGFGRSRADLTLVCKARDLLRGLLQGAIKIGRGGKDGRKGVGKQVAVVQEVLWGSIDLFNAACTKQE